MSATKNSLKLTICFVVLFIVFLSKAEASVTQSDAVKWARAQKDRTGNCDVDGNGLWCVDLATAYMNYCWLQTNNQSNDPWGLYPYTTKMAYEYDNYVSGNVNWTVITRNNTTVPQPGDIFVSETDSAGHGYGHVGIVLTPYGSSSAEIIEMSGGVRPNIKTVTWGSTASYNAQHFIRFNYFALAQGALDVNGWLDGDSNAGNVAGYGTFDVYINGSLVGNDVNDYYNSSLPAGTTYEIKDIRATSGHVYSGVASGSTSGTIGSGATRDVRLKFLSQYTIGYSANGGSGAPASQTKTYGTALTLSSTVPTRTGYTFQGWSTSSSATSATYSAGGSYTSNAAATLYAVWKANSYTVTLNANGGSVSPTSKTATYNSTYGSLPTPSRSGYVFDGWYTASSGGSKVTSSTKVTSTGNHTLYAHWRAITKMKLPSALTAVGERAFEYTAPNVVDIPGNVKSIDARAFAGNAQLYTVVIRSKTLTIASDAFADCPNLTICAYADTPAEYYAVAKNIPFIELKTSEWVEESDMPVGASVVSEKWTYTQSTIETTTSTATSMSGWTQDGYTWQQTGTGTHTYANYPAGFDTGHSLYGKYAKSALSSSISGNTKREVSSSSSLVDYIYWHWTFTDYVESTNRNVLIEDTRKLNVNVGGSVYRDFIYFDAFETTVSLNPEGMSTSGLKTYPDMYSTYHHPEYNLPEYASWWWYRFEVRRQTYTDSQKLFTYRKTTAVQKESSTQVTAGGNISNVKRMVKYIF